MTRMTVTEVARNFRAVLDRVEFEGEEVVLIRNQRQVARIVPGAGHQTAIEAMGDLYRTITDEAARSWLDDARGVARSGKGGRVRGRPRGRVTELRDPWAS